MFGLFRSVPFVDPVLGKLVRSRGRWRGQVALVGKPVPLALAGPRDVPDAAALAIGRELASVWRDNRRRVEAALFEHYEPYREAVASGELEAPAAPMQVASPSDLWSHVEAKSASVTWQGRSLVAEVALAVAWDEEHTLGARFIEREFSELNGSILAE